MKTAISIPDPLFKAAERLAKRLGMSRSELYQKAVQRYVKDHDSGEDITEALNRFYDEHPELRNLDPDIARLQSASIGKSDW